MMKDDSPLTRLTDLTRSLLAVSRKELERRASAYRKKRKADAPASIGQQRNHRTINQ